MNAIDFLIEEHNKVRKMLSNIEKNLESKEEKKSKFDKLSDVLIRHENMEHEVWYPNFKNDLSKEVTHLLKEEKIAEKEINKLKKLYDESDKIWADAFLKFKKDVEYHAQEEEQSLFPEVQSLLTETKLNTIGKAMKEYEKAHPLS